jgi:hypothetical protein
MDQQSIVLYLSRKGLLAIAIHDDLVATLGAEAVSYLSVTRYLHEAIFASSRSPISPSHQFASYHDSHGDQERLSTDD